MEKKVHVIDDRDNVANAIVDISAGEEISIGDGEDRTIVANDDVPYGHKIALTGLEVGDAVLKYGEEIGAASERIQVGDHVHVHNVESRRGRGDLEAATS